MDMKMKRMNTNGQIIYQKLAQKIIKIKKEVQENIVVNLLHLLQQQEVVALIQIDINKTDISFISLIFFILLSRIVTSCTRC